MEDTWIEVIRQKLQRYNRPIYETVIDTLQKMIASGQLTPGTKFPPDKKLAIELGISHITLAKALNELRRRNVLERRRAFGTSVPERRDEETPLRRKIAVVFDNADEETFRRTSFLAIHRELEKLNCTMVFLSSDGDSMKQKNQLLKIMQDFSISGCLVWSILSQEEAESVLHERPQNYPLIFLDKYYTGFNHDAVTYRNYDCGVAMGRRIRRRKSEHVYWVCCESILGFSSVINRRKGLFDGLAAQTEPKTIVLTGDTDLADQVWEKDAVVVCGNQTSAICFRNAMLKQGKALPKQCFTFETFSEDHGLVPEFISYRFENELGTEAVKTLASRLNGREDCTVNHSGKWSVLGAKKISLNKRRICSNETLFHEKEDG